MRPLAGSLVVAIFAFLLANAACADELDDEFDQIEAIEDVNEGELSFLPFKPQAQIHHHQMEIDMTGPWLDDGWVLIKQCHSDLDAVSRSQILFARDRVRELEVTAFDGVGDAWVKGHTVQLADIKPGASLCLRAYTQAVEITDDAIILRNGPFMRRFLDGYYPMSVVLAVRFDPKRHRFDSMFPPPQAGLRVWHNPGLVRFEAWFEGRLRTELRFKILPPAETE